MSDSLPPKAACETSAFQTANRRRSDPEQLGAPFDFDITLPDEVLPAFAIRWGGSQALPHSGSPHLLTDYPFGSFVFIIQGEGIFECENQSWPVRPGSVYWASPGMTTCVVLNEGSPKMAHYVIMPFGTKVETWFIEYLGARCGAGPVLDPDSLATLFEAILDEGCSASSDRAQNCEDLVKVLLRRMKTQLNQESRPAGSSSAQDTFHRAQLYIRKNYANTPDLGRVAGAIGISVPYLCRLYDRFYSTTAFDQLSKLKLRKAERLLCSSNLSIREISEAVGYAELHHFSRNFRKTFGLSPSYYRKQKLNPPGQTPD